MTPLQFGSSTVTLFGLYQGALATPARDVGVVLCNPFGHEAIRSHRAYRQLALLLAKNRFHTMRFDYRGTGDSSGDGEDATWQQWIEDVGTASDELKDMAGVSKLAWVGLRLGATIAALAAHARRGQRDLDQLVLWDPVVEGRAYLDELYRTHVDFMRSESPLWQAGRGQPTTGESLGFPLGDALRRELELVDLKAPGAGGESHPRKVALVVSDETPAVRALRDRLALAGSTFSYDHLPQAGLWNSDEALNSTLVPMEALQAILARLS